MAGNMHCKMRSMKFIQNYHNEHTKFNFGMLIVVILYEFHTSHFAVCRWQRSCFTSCNEAAKENITVKIGEQA